MTGDLGRRERESGRMKTEGGGGGNGHDETRQDQFDTVAIILGTML